MGLDNEIKAKAHFEKALEITQAFRGKHHVETFTTAFELANFFYLNFEIESCRKILSEIELASPQMPEALALSYKKLRMHIKRREGLLKQALAGYRDILDEGEKVWGQKAQYIDSLRGYAITQRELKNYRDAIESFQKILKLQETLYGPEGHHEIIHTLNNLANAYTLIGDYKRAEILLTRIVKKRTSELGERHRSTIISIHNLGYLFLKAERYHKAEVNLSKAAKLFDLELGFHSLTFTATNNLGQAKLKRNQFSKALLLYQYLSRQSEKTWGVTDPKTLLANHNLGLCLLETGQWVEAQTILQKTLQHRKKVLGREKRQYSAHIIRVGQEPDEAAKLQAARLIIFTMHTGVHYG